MHLGNYLTSCFFLNKFKAFPNILKRLDAIPRETFEEERDHFQNVLHFELIYYINTNQYQEAIDLAKIIEQQLDTKFKGALTHAREISMSYNIACLYVVVEDYTAALTWIQRINNFEKADIRRDTRRIARILQIIAHYELENDRVVEHMLSNTPRSLSRTLKLDALEELILKYLKVLQNTPTYPKVGRQAIFQKFKEELTEFSATYNNPEGVGVVSVWIENRLRK